MVFSEGLWTQMWCELCD